MLVFALGLFFFDSDPAFAVILSLLLIGHLLLDELLFIKILL